MTYMAQTGNGDRFKVATLEDLASIYRPPHNNVLRKVTDHITAPGRAFIAASPFLVLATAGKGGIDCSPKGDQPGFVQVSDSRTLLIPDRPGNNRIDGMRNLVVNSQVGIIFMVPGANETYRVNGTATISTDPALLSRFMVAAKLPRAVLVVTVEEAYSHCPKALVRSDLWRAAAAGRPQAAPSHGQFAAYRDGGDDAYARKYDTEYAKRIPEELY
jgi:PPOX class probable FMN-dependent enzyme